MSSWQRAVIGLASLVACAGCDDNLDDDETYGELGSGVFRYICVDRTDRLCANGGEPDDFPTVVAATGRFDLGVRDLPRTRSAGIRPASERYVEIEERSWFRAVAPGTVAMLALREDNGWVTDLIHLRVEEVSTITIGGRSGVRVGDRLELSADPHLAGALDYSWSSMDESVATVERVPDSARATFVATGVGRAEIVVEAGGGLGTLTLDVEDRPLPGAVPVPDAGAPDADASDAWATDADGGDDDAGL